MPSSLKLDSNKKITGCISTGITFEKKIKHLILTFDRMSDLVDGRKILKLKIFFL